MDISSAVWNETDASNTTAAPDGSPEGMAPSGVNNVLRAHQGAIKRFWKRSSVITTAGTSSAYTVTHSVAPAALADGETELVQFHAANAAAATLNVSALGAIPLHYYSAGAWRAVPAALWAADQVFRVAYNTSAAAYRILDLLDRTGEVVSFAGATAPAGALLCYGQAISRTAYAGLFAALSTTHGVGDGSSTFNLPDLRGRVAAGKGDMGGSESGRLNTYVASTLGAAGGAQSESADVTVSTISGATSGSLTYSGTTSDETVAPFSAAGGPGPVSTSVHQHTFSGSTSGALSVYGTGSGTTASATNVQPTMALNYVIRI